MSLMASTAHFTPVGGMNYQPVTPTVLAAGTYWIAALIYPGAGIGGTVTTDGLLYWPNTSTLDETRTRFMSWTLASMDLLPTITATGGGWQLTHFAYYCP